MQARPDLTPGDVRNSPTPVVIQENGRTAVIVALDRNFASPQEQANYMRILRDEILRGYFNAPENAGRNIPAGLQEILINEENNEEDAIGTIIETIGGDDFTDVIASDFSVINIAAITSQDQFFNSVDPARLPPNAIEIVSYFALQHELAHAFCDTAAEVRDADIYKRPALMDPGADYIAAANTIIAYPDARNVLTLTADYRTALGVSLLSGDPGVDSHSSATETASGRAIRAVLEISPERLAALAAMDPAARRQALLEDAREFDREMNGFENAHPERNVFNAVFKRAWDTAKNRHTEQLTELSRNTTDPEALRKIQQEIQDLASGAKIPDEIQNIGDKADRPFIDPDNRRILYEAARDLLIDCDTKEPPPFPRDRDEYKILKDYVESARRIVEARYDSPASEKTLAAKQEPEKTPDLANAAGLSQYYRTDSTLKYGAMLTGDPAAGLASMIKSDPVAKGFSLTDNWNAALEADAGAVQGLTPPAPEPAQQMTPANTVKLQPAS